MDFDLRALQERRDTARKAGEHWVCSAKDLIAAYAVGERDFDGANLWGANLWDANLEGANLRGATFWDANLEGANLEGANLEGANLRGATLPSGFHVLRLSPVGSRRAELGAYVYPDGTQRVTTGCFSGTLEAFIAAIERKPEGDPYRVEYESIAVPALKAFFALHAVEKTPEEA